MKEKATCCIIVLLCLFSKVNAQASKLTARVLVVANTNSPVSIAVANDYMSRRGVTNLLSISCPDDAANRKAEDIDYAAYLNAIEAPLLAYLAIHTEIDFIVFTKGVPIRITNAPDKPDGNCSLDSRVASLGYQNNPGSSIISINSPDYGSDYIGNAWLNKFFNSQGRFSHGTFGGYLVTRLDGYTQADAMALTTRSLEAEKNLSNGISAGPILLDACPDYGFTDIKLEPYTLIPANYKPGQTIYITHESDLGDYNADMIVANDSLASNAVPVLYDDTPVFIGNKTNLGGYVSWGSNDTHFDVNAYHSLTFLAGAIGETVVSTSARTLLPAAGGQSLIGDLISQGITGVKGYTDEPMMQEIASPSVLFNRYTRGWTLAESFYAASRSINWMGIVIGDPICTAYNLSGPFSNGMIYYPNPGSDIINVNVYGQYTYKVYDMNGRLMKSGKLVNKQIDIHDLTSGIYIMAITNGTAVINKKIIKLD